MITKKELLKRVTELEKHEVKVRIGWHKEYSPFFNYQYDAPTYATLQEFVDAVMEHCKLTAEIVPAKDKKVLIKKEKKDGDTQTVGK